MTTGLFLTWLMARLLALLRDHLRFTGLRPEQSRAVIGFSERELKIAITTKRRKQTVFFGWRALYSAYQSAPRVSDHHWFYVQHNKLWQLQADNWNKSTICSFTVTIGQAVYLDLCTVGFYWFSESNYDTAWYTRKNNKWLLLPEVTEIGGKKCK